MELGLEDSVALVTGGGSGIGRAIALELARERATVVVNDIDEARAKAVSDECAALSGKEGVPLVVDVSDGPALESALDGVAEVVGPIDLLVNNVGVWFVSPFAESSEKDWKRELDVNLMATAICCKAVLPGMVARGGGSIVSISSEAARAGEPLMVMYSAAKAALGGLTRALARETGPDGVRVNCVSLASTRTEGAERTLPEAAWDRLAKTYPLRRVGSPEDVASAVVFLLSSKASWITGQTLGVNGGYLMP